MSESPDNKAMTYMFALAALAFVGIYWYYVKESLKQQENILEDIKGHRMGGGSSSNNSHSPEHEGSITDFPVREDSE